MARRKVLQASVVNPDDSTDIVKVSVGELVRTPIWMFRKAVSKLAELRPETRADAIWSMIKDRSYVDEYEYRGYKDDLSPLIWMMYVDFKDIRQTPLETVCLWIIRCSHYYWFDGPRPDVRHKPRKKSTQVTTESWRNNLVCPSCNEIFTYDGIMLDTRPNVMIKFNKWMSAHIKVCSNLVWKKWDKNYLTKVKKQVDDEREIREKLALEKYNDWVKSLERGNDTPVVMAEWASYLNTVRKGIDKIRNLRKAGKVVVALISMRMLLKYAERHGVTPQLKSELRVLCEEMNVVMPRL
jgi:hypothetical protein